MTNQKRTPKQAAIKTSKINKCKGIIKQKSLLDLLNYASKNHLIEDCGEDWFTFIFVYQDFVDHPIGVRVTRNGREISIILPLAEVDSFDDECVICVTSRSTDTNFKMIPSTHEENGRKYVILRRDLRADDEDLFVNRDNLSDTILNIQHFLDCLPEGFVRQFMSWLVPSKNTFPGTSDIRPFKRR